MDDLDRIRAVYAERARVLGGSSLYDRSNPGQLHMAHSRERAFLRKLESEDALPLRDCEILDVGCGSGDLLLELLRDGAEPGRLHGVDLLEDRVTRAATRLPNLDIRCADAQELPFDDGIFDLVLQYTVLTSILDRTVRERIAREMLRVVRKPCGLIISYDFWLNPFNRDTRGLRPSEIRRLFPGCRCSFTSLTLAPPIVRRLARVSWLSCDFLEAARLLNTHYLVAIQPPATEVTSRRDPIATIGRGSALVPGEPRIGAGEGPSARPEDGCDLCMRYPIEGLARGHDCLAR